MENLNINGDNGSSSQRLNLTQAELLDLCLVGRVVVGALVRSHIGKMLKFDEENNYRSRRRFMMVRVEIAVEEPLQQELVIEREEGESIRLVFNDKFESCSASSKKKWGAYLRAENDSVGSSHKEATKWIVGGRSKNYGGRKEGGKTINDNHNRHSMAIDGINAESRSLTFFRYMECQRLDGTGLVRWWTEIDLTEITSGGSKSGGGQDQNKNICFESHKIRSKAMWKLIELETQQKVSLQNSKAGGKKVEALLANICKKDMFVTRIEDASSGSMGGKISKTVISMDKCKQARGNKGKGEDVADNRAPQALVHNPVQPDSFMASVT
ncbi:hypothetical protein MTR_6g053790 [Medicago truncatula]|uniref:Uncharacterized protein n=1 Tax=Medicago truncatula TaxID=3880 RepID=A0A072UBH2_MEDTR|nr:hypothetical protein MTR_6g053790 [Medicago truncatula]